MKPELFLTITPSLCLSGEPELWLQLRFSFNTAQMFAHVSVCRSKSSIYSGNRMLSGVISSSAFLRRPRVLLNSSFIAFKLWFHYA